ncbi:23S rRNA (guanosine(2251)-2'-O)-methyltransferase RlmB [Mycoplasmoides gallisepticum]|uniref:23S rRNA (Guanosine(2251)-2'-O)-methyltransferase RlmB n=1 Tax=Mycoplasmoides gallisepticum TaxID=2096 RepID=A0AB36DTC4_MYCGL|nr:23S rRNA (guanosine(2251)-2'-O)-methyltransferase RlmB [Mycoplasmoides gallisepticum]OBU78487.1 23S rRNA (guanosine(2251)-2'-O)-methyltransferase RlmB [Mycoplasmoides gallisepticum]OBU79454.1 23S rRNA (guanosine(2251)-2'-O)-methyltransferase RlmB [Mycoplasmoides gallisepticum]OBU80343.1 23S rRNA (guanosine(2251)-2'-O)-methyltransferase RlmB [Mycoplasmoides gallisepticum]OBU80752.1 23S rRNA (guanosine(2251)-2'-O)-methyltransferase RlmB [Mycoplasmoides gallisepticum]OBU81451.1 23S rRNA (guano
MKNQFNSQFNNKHPNKHKKERLCLFGYNAVYEGLINNLKIKKVYLHKEDHLLLKLIKQKGIEYELHTIKWFDNQYRDLSNHQGFVAEIDGSSLTISFNQFCEKIKNEQQGIVVVLDQIHDPGNFGGILRSCLAANVLGVIFKKDNQASINNTVIKTSLGACFYLNLIEVANLSYAIKDLQDKYGFWSYVSNLSDQAQDYNVDYANKSILIVGNEQKGVSSQLIKNADYQIKIPMYTDKIQSLNVSVATGIMLFNMKQKIK